MGFSAETGDLSDNHDIISVNTKNLYDTNTQNNKDKDAQPQHGNGNSRAGKKGQGILSKKKKPAGSWSWFFVKCFIGVAVLGGGYVGYTAWRTQQRRSHRF